MIFKYNIGDSVLINESSHELIVVDMHKYSCSRSQNS